MAKKAAAAAARIVGRAPDRIETPGGSSRESVRLIFGEARVFASYRKSVERARLEARVLRALGWEDAPVPRLLAFDGRWVFQEDVGGHRLTAALRDDTDRWEAWLEAGIDALVRCQRAGVAAGLERTVHRIGAGQGWLGRLARLPSGIGDSMDLPPPETDHAALAKAIEPRESYLVKWDARPGNGAARADGSVVWFDWEHCGVRNRIDDLVWYLGDEYTPDLGTAEPEVLNRWLGEVGPDDRKAGLDYFYTFGVLHSLVRFHLAIVRKGDGPWFDPDKALDSDRVGRTPEQGVLLCRRAARWAEQVALTRPLVPWFEALAEKVPTL